MWNYNEGGFKDESVHLRHQEGSIWRGQRAKATWQGSSYTHSSIIFDQISQRITLYEEIWRGFAGY